MRCRECKALMPIPWTESTCMNCGAILPIAPKTTAGPLGGVGADNRPSGQPSSQTPQEAPNPPAVPSLPVNFGKQGSLFGPGIRH